MRKETILGAVSRKTKEVLDKRRVERYYRTKGQEIDRRQFYSEMNEIEKKVIFNIIKKLRGIPNKVYSELQVNIAVGAIGFGSTAKPKRIRLGEPNDRDIRVVFSHTDTKTKALIDIDKLQAINALIVNAISEELKNLSQDIFEISSQSYAQHTVRLIGSSSTGNEILFTPSQEVVGFVNYNNTDHSFVVASKGNTSFVPIHILVSSPESLSLQDHLKRERKKHQFFSLLYNSQTA